MFGFLFGRVVAWEWTWELSYQKHQPFQFWELWENLAVSSPNSYWATMLLLHGFLSDFKHLCIPLSSPFRRSLSFVQRIFHILTRCCCRCYCCCSVRKCISNVNHHKTIAIKLTVLPTILSASCSLYCCSMWDYEGWRERQRNNGYKVDHLVKKWSSILLYVG